MKYRVKYEVMKPQLTNRGKTKLDRFGEPLRSVRLKQSGDQKTNMMETLAMLYKMWSDRPGIWGDQKHFVGNDPVSYTPAEMFNDLRAKFTEWRNHKNNDIYKSFIDRHNFLMDLYIRRVTELRDEMPQRYAELDLFEMMRIELVDAKRLYEQMTDAIESNDLFQISKRKF